MSSHLLPTLNQFLVFVLVLTRLSGLVMTVPVFGSRTLPRRVRTLLAVALALLVTPLYWAVPPPVPDDLVHLFVLLGRELALGVGLGTGVLILLVGLQLTGEIIGQMSGMQLADIFNPSLDSTVPMFSQLLDLVALVVFVAIGGHREVMAALLETFRWMPPGQVHLAPDLLGALTEVIARSFILGLRAAAPMMIALLLSVLIMGLISRTLPQLNIIAVGFSFNAMVMLATLAISLGGAAWVFQQEAGTALEAIRQAMLAGVPLSHG